MKHHRHVKHLKSSAAGLRTALAQALVARHVAEELASFDASSPVAEVRDFMRRKDFDVVGVRDDGFVYGYAEADHPGDCAIGHCVRSFDEATCIGEDEPLSRIFSFLQVSPRVFVVRNDRVTGIITRGDLEKAPVRMWLFALVSLIEMQLLRLIREHYPGETWRRVLSDGRVEKAEQICDKRHADKTHIDLADCLQFCDKRDIVLKTPALFQSLSLEAFPDPSTLFKELQDLRDDLAHAQSVVLGRWPRLVELSRAAEGILTSCESARVDPDGAC